MNRKTEMGYYKSFYGAYGVQISYLDMSEEEVMEIIGTDVRYLAAGAYDRHKDWLYVSEAQEAIERETGDYRMVSPYFGSDERIKDWDWKLVQAAQILKVDIELGPGYFFVADMS
jgi:hypothetical protein